MSDTVTQKHLSSKPSPEARAAAQMMTEEVEAVAREHAAAIGFDMAKEPNALFRMMIAVLSSAELRRKVDERVKARRELPG